MNLPAHQPAAWEPEAEESTASGWFPGPLVRKLLLVALAAIALSGSLAAWWVSHAMGQEAMDRLVSQQNDEVELVARLLASKIEQSQKVLSTVAEGITPEILESPASLGWLLQQGLPAVRFFDAIQVARKDGTLSVNLRYGRLAKASDLDPTERDYLVRTLVNGKPLVSGLIGNSPTDARVMFTMPLLRGEGRVMGVVSGVLRLQSQGLLPHSLSLPERSDSRLVIFTRDGVILSHPNLERVLGQVSDEPGLAQAYADWRAAGQTFAGGAAAQPQADHVVSLAGVPMPQWMVARVSDAQSMLAPLQQAQRRAWGQVAVAAGGVCLLATLFMLWLARPLTLLRLRVRAALEADERSASTAEGADEPWPRSSGEVDDVVRVCTRLLEGRRKSQRGADTLVRQLQAVLEHVPLGIAVTRAEQVEVVSQQVCRLLGHAPQELQGRNLIDLLAPHEDGLDTAQQVHEAFAAHGAFDGELPLLRKDGSVLWGHVRGQLVQPGEPGRGVVWTVQDCTAEREARAQQAWESSHDALTQLLDHGEFERRLRVLLAERAQRAAQPGALAPEQGVLLFMDVDHFTVVNDLAGRAVADDVLRRLARLLEAEVQRSGWAARLGGDEFAVLLPASSLANGQAVAERLRATVRAWEPAYQGRSFTLGLSIGLVPLAPGLRDAAAVLHAADMACYEAQCAGRNRVHLGAVRVRA
ncbi:sensor domain-containing diguanylate cyclase [Diaphorobacter limosus]|uniref:Diguanylate cyclase n=1 Tax=Diaphorobacter limosus TaxID=3036128 RepID=A0ABZ0J6D2_9BURK|nr:diguanylate cyclase [Diaphorobacter sp. Y-1]WOO33820.1 diguanylate cyclase [Diaphorobacter sp. Y-1]